MTSILADTRDANNSNALGLKPFFKGKVEALEIAVRDGTQNLRRLEAQRNELNSRGLCSSFHRQCAWYSRSFIFGVAFRRAFYCCFWSLSSSLCARVSVCKRLFLDGDGMMFERSTREAKRSAKRDETTFRDEHPFKKNKRWPNLNTTLSFI